MQNKKQYRGVIKYHENVVCDFQTKDTLYAIARLARLMADEYPYAKGEIIDLVTGKIVYACCQTSIC
ncbi:MAG: hypothetical protein K0S27_1108 [Gammaproteobacteria bacterium]|jgi:hypothetical protein|nr:hypothetical protein [Gammaproteobacteria bacterium]